MFCFFSETRSRQQVCDYHVPEMLALCFSLPLHGDLLMLGDCMWAVQHLHLALKCPFPVRLQFLFTALFLRRVFPKLFWLKSVQDSPMNFYCLPDTLVISLWRFLYKFHVYPPFFHIQWNLFGGLRGRLVQSCAVGHKCLANHVFSPVPLSSRVPSLIFLLSCLCL